jgi:hypothetical protein
MGRKRKTFLDKELAKKCGNELQAPGFWHPKKLFRVVLDLLNEFSKDN